MKKIYTISILFVLFTSLLNLSGCSEDQTNPIVNNPPASGTNTVIYTSTNGGTLNYDNVSITVLPNSVPAQQNGNAGSVTFSIETSNSLDPNIPALPAEFSLIGKYVKIGPDGFVFRFPVQCVLPAASESSPDGLAIAKYNPDIQSWKIYPMSYIDTVNKKIGINSLALGYFAVVRVSSGMRAPDGSGGMRYGSDQGVWHTITIASAVLKFPAQSSWYPGGTPVGSTFSSGSDATGSFPNNPCHAIIAQGNYSVWISRTYLVGSVYRTYTYSLPVPVNLENPLSWGGWGNSSGYVDVSPNIPQGGTWVEGYPTNWAPPTVTYGTGNFQATLTWINPPTVDLDLHLYGPNNMHVSYQNEVFGDSILVLDRDWTSASGNAIENIYNSKGTMPSGTYQVKVNYYSGSGTKQFNCRVILNGNVIASYSGSLSSGEVLIKEFTY